MGDDPRDRADHPVITFFLHFSELDRFSYPIASPDSTSYYSLSLREIKNEKTTENISQKLFCPTMERNYNYLAFFCQIRSYAFKNSTIRLNAVGRSLSSSGKRIASK